MPHHIAALNAVCGGYSKYWFLTLNFFFLALKIFLFLQLFRHFMFFSYFYISYIHINCPEIISVTFFALSCPCVIEKLLFWGRIFKIEIFINLQDFEIPWIQKITFLVIGLCVYLLSAQLYVNNSLKFNFDIIDLYHREVPLETFYGDHTNTLCIGAHKRIQIHYSLSTESLVNTF